jgi:membrane protein DedA with SNARE-associated domain
VEKIIFAIIEKMGYLGVFILTIIENLFPPIPSEVILLFSGFVTTKTNLSCFFMIIYSLFGSLIGALILYFIARLLNKEKIKTVINAKVLKKLKIEESDIEKSQVWFIEKGDKAVFICRFIPVVRSLISIPAGMSKMNLLKFVIYTGLGAFLWNSALVVLGNQLGEKWVNIAFIVDKFSLAILVVLTICIVVFYIYIVRKRKKSKLT